MNPGPSTKESNQEIINQIKTWVATSRSSVIPVNLQNYDMVTIDFINLMQDNVDKTSNLKILYEFLQDAVERYKREPELAHVPPLFFKLPGESWDKYIKRCYEAHGNYF